MSLQVWLPLNGDLHNQGLSDVTVTNNGATINNNGKIGKCYSFDGNDDYISLTSSVLYSIITGGNQPFSIAMWVYHADATRAILFGDYGLGGINFNIELTTGHALRFYWAGSPDKNFTITVDASQWAHICLVYDGTQILVYKNGIIQSDKYTGILATKTKTAGAYYLGRDSRTGTTAFNGKMNDVRIYDHALSAKEVEEIAKGLVLHYKLDNNGLGNPNLLINSLDASSGSGASGITKSISSNGEQIIVAESGNGNWVTFGNHNTTLDLAKGDTFTFSLKIKSSNSTKKPTVYFQSGMGYFSMQGTMSNEYSIIYYTGTWNIDNLTTNIHLGFSSAPGTYYIEYFKLEKGNEYTPWAPSVKDVKYGNIPSNIIYDSSGYRNNGIIVGSLTTSTPSPRYSCATKFDGSSSVKFLDFNLGNVWSAGIWFYSPSTSTQMWSSLFAVNNNGGDSDLKMNIYYQQTSKSLQYSANGQYVSGIGYPDKDKWHQVFEVFDGVNLYCYLDGSLIRTKSITNSEYTKKNLVIGARSSAIDGSTTTGYFEGKLSDFRIYATALTEAQVKELYNTSMSIDNAGNIHARELVE